MASEDRTRVRDAPRSATGREWELFVRQDADAALEHVGSVTASDADDAHEHVSRLFGWTARDVWLCPADEMRRYTTHTLGGESGGERTRHDGAAAESSAAESGGESP